MPSDISAPLPPAQPPRRQATLRTISALMLREMSTTYGRSALGYVWAILEPAAGILLLTMIFSLMLRSPPLGTNFPLFYASGFLPFMAYNDISQKVSVSLRFSKALMFYPGVTFLDALTARLLINSITQIMVAGIVFGAIIWFSGVDILFDPVALAHGFFMAFVLALGIGTLNCYLLSLFPVWERTWAVVTRPLFIISGVLFLVDSVPEPYQGWLMWNPLVHVVGEVRRGIFNTYVGDYISPLYVYAVALVTFAAGLLLLRRYNREIANL
ncbi:sugar ABC transporter permease [Roseovarius sp. A21]|uniref:Transport permease protein n=2 Tax=Roseovarius bejariae TaxID=2576383 RepID=A0A844CXZ4_9RHOB|nr:sugar ABC transporter permease [Roseovarius bejariae]